MASLTTHGLRQSTHRRFVVADIADPGAVRRTVMEYARQLHPSPEFAARAAQVGTELAANLLTHAARGGWILARPLPPDAVEILAVDKGPGITDVVAAVEGRSPAPQGLGCGLAAVRRAANHFDVYSRAGAGTVVLAVVSADHHGPAPWPSPPRRWAGVSIGIEDPCGDGWCVSTLDGGLAVLVSDGLGHGPHASRATDAAVDSLAGHRGGDFTGYLNRANAAMRDTRGAAVALCWLDTAQRELSAISVGNVSGSIWAGGRHQHLVPYSGTLGLRPAPPVAKVMRYPWPPGATLVLWTDGLSSRLDLSEEPDLLRHDPAVVAAALHRDHCRERDDATVVVVHDDTGG